MMNKEIIKQIELVEAAYEKISEGLDKNNPYDLNNWCYSLVTQYYDGGEVLKLLHMLDSLETKVLLVTEEELRDVVIALKFMKIHPKGKFNKQGVYFLKDHELLPNITPTKEYPLVQMNSARKYAFVKAIAYKYNPQSVEELFKLFDSIIPDPRACMK